MIDTREGRINACSEEIYRHQILEYQNVTNTQRQPRKDFMDAFELSESDFEDSDSISSHPLHFQQDVD